MAMSTTERAKIAGKACAAKLTPEQRRERGYAGRRGAAVNRVIRDIHLLNDDQRARLRQALQA